MRRWTVWLMWCAMSLPVTGLQAAEPYGDCRLGTWSSTRNMDATRDVYPAVCNISYRPVLTEQLSLGFSGRAGYAQTGNGRRASGRATEFYADVTHDRWMLRVGRQMLAWGRADRINPTDYLSPRDFTYLTHEDDEQRIGIDAASLRVEVAPQSYVTLVAARAKGHVTPTGSLPPRTSLSASSGMDYAVKWDASSSGVDWSLSYFEGHDRFARYRAQALGAGMAGFVGHYPRMRAVGFDAATASGDWTARLEASHAVLTDDCQGCVAPQRHVTRLVVGADRNVGESGNVNVQWFAVRRSYAEPAPGPQALRALHEGLDRLNSEFGRAEYGYTVRWADRFYNDKLRLEMGALFDLKRGSQVLRPRLSYEMTDRVRVLVGADHFSGQHQSYFGSRKANNVVFASVTFQF